MSRPWYAHFVADYRRKTPHLTMIEHGAYRLLLDEYYANGPFSTIVDRLYRICRAFDPTERATIDRILVEFFPVKDGFHRNARADEEIAKAVSLGETRRKAVLSRKDRQSTIVPTIVVPSPSPSPSPSQTQIDNSVAHTKRAAREKRAAGDDEFVLPEWVPSEPWAAFLEMRKRSRSPPTARAVKMLIAELGRLRDAGDGPAAVLDQSTMNGWKGLFSLKKGNGHDKKPTGHQAFLEGAYLFATRDRGNAVRDADGDAGGAGDDTGAAGGAFRKP